MKSRTGGRLSFIQRKRYFFYRNIQGQIEAEKGKEHASKLYGWAFGYKIGPISEGQFVHALFLETNEQKYYDFAIRQADTFVEAGIEEDEKYIGVMQWISSATQEE